MSCNKDDGLISSVKIILYTKLNIIEKNNEDVTL